MYNFVGTSWSESAETVGIRGTTGEHARVLSRLNPEVLEGANAVLAPSKATTDGPARPFSPNLLKGEKQHRSPVEHGVAENAGRPDIIEPRAPCCIQIGPLPSPKTVDVAALIATTPGTTSARATSCTQTGSLQNFVRRLPGRADVGAAGTQATTVELARPEFRRATPPCGAIEYPCPVLTWLGQAHWPVKLGIRFST